MYTLIESFPDKGLYKGIYFEFFKQKSNLKFSNLWAIFSKLQWRLRKIFYYNNFRYIN